MFNEPNQRVSLAHRCVDDERHIGAIRSRDSIASCDARRESKDAADTRFTGLRTLHLPHFVREAGRAARAGGPIKARLA
jgi:hypothetical protein